MEYLSTNKIAIVDLTNSKVSDQELDEDLAREKIGEQGSRQLSMSNIRMRIPLFWELDC